MFKNTWRIFLSLFLILISFGWSVVVPQEVKAAGNTYYVATTGNDSTGNGSLATPWATPQKAATVMVAGDTCYIEAGTYTTTIPFWNGNWSGGVEVAAMIACQNSGTAGNPITFENYQGGVVNLNLNTATYSADEEMEVDTNGCSYINIQGLNFSGLDGVSTASLVWEGSSATNPVSPSTGWVYYNTANYISYVYTGSVWWMSPTWGIEICNNANPLTRNSGIESTNINITNCSVYGVYDSGLAGVCASNCTVNGCTIEYNTFYASNGQTCYFVQGSGNTIENCTVGDCIGSGRIGIDNIASSNCTIHNNTVLNVSSIGIYAGNDPTDSGNLSNVNIFDNNVSNCGVGGIGLAAENGAGTISGISIYNNTIYSNARGFRVDQYGTETYNFTFINNTLYDNGTGGVNTEIYIGSTHTYLSSCVIRNNIIDNNTSGSYAIEYSDYANGGITVDHNLFYNSGGSWNGSNVLGTSSQSGNPNLSNPTTSFALTSNSTLAINNGSSTSAPSTDYIGTIRPQGTSYDIGAYEFLTNPTLTVSAPTNIAATSATLNGNVTYVGVANPTITIYYDTTNYGNTTVGWANNVSATYAGGIASFSANVSSLVAGTLYYFNAKADNTGSGGGVSWSGASSFIDLPNAPTSPLATPITSQVNFSWTPATGGTGTTIYTQIQYSVSGYPSAYNTGVTGLSWTNSSSGAVSGLVGGQLYYFSLFSEAVNGTNISYSVADATISATPLTGTTTGTTTGLPNNPNGFVDAPVIGQVGGDNYVIIGSILNSSFLINSITGSGGTTTTGTNQILGSSEGKLLWETLLPLAIIIFGAIMIFMNWKHPVKMMVIFIILVLMLIIVQAFIRAIG